MLLTRFRSIILFHVRLKFLNNLLTAKFGPGTFVIDKVLLYSKILRGKQSINDRENFNRCRLKLDAWISCFPGATGVNNDFSFRGPSHKNFQRASKNRARRLPFKTKGAINLS